MQIEARELTHEEALDLVAVMANVTCRDTGELTIYRGENAEGAYYVIIAPSGTSLVLPISIHVSD